jgi:trigger factor
MQVTQTLSEGLKQEYRIVVPADEIEAQVREKLDALRGQVQIKGFRRGKAPLTLLRKRFGESVMSEVLQSTIDRSSQQAMLDHNVRPAERPNIEVERFESGSDLAFTMSLEALPEFEPCELKDIKLVRYRAEVEDQTVEEALAQLAAQQTSFSDAPEGRKAEPGDALMIDFTGTIDGEPFEGGSAQDFRLVLGSNMFIPGFEDQLAGAKAGDHVEVKVRFPDDYSAEAVRGKEASFAVDVKQVLVPETAAVDDALATRLGMADLAALRAAVRERIQRDYNQTSRLRLKRDLLDRLAESHDFEVPPGRLEAEFETIWHQIEHDMEHAGKTWADSEQTEEDARAEYRAIAERRIRLGLLLMEIGRRNNITVPQEELNRAVMEQARRFPGQEQQVFDYFRNNAQAMTELHAPLFEDKVIDFILEMAEVEDRTVPAAELTVDPEAQAAEPAGQTQEK